MIVKTGAAMMKTKAICLGLFTAALAVAPSVSLAQTAPTARSACAASETSERGKPIPFAATINEKTWRSLGAVTLLALSGPRADWPSADFKLPPLCEIGSLTIGSDVFVLRRNSGDGPVIWAQSKTSGLIVFLALGPDLDSAYKWHAKGGRGSMSPKAPSFVLTLMREDDPQLYATRIYDDMPPLKMLEADIAATIRQELPTIAIYHREDQRTSVRLPSRIKDGERFWR